MVRFGSVRSGSVRSGSVRFDFDWVRPVLIGLYIMRYKAARLGVVRSGLSQNSSAQAASGSFTDNQLAVVLRLEATVLCSSFLSTYLLPVSGLVSRLHLLTTLMRT